MKPKNTLSSILVSYPALVPARPARPRFRVPWLVLAILAGWSAPANAQPANDDFALAGWSAPANPQPANDNCATPTVVTVWPFTDTLNTTMATTAASDPVHSCSSDTDYNSVWYSVTLRKTGTIVVDISGTTYTTVVGVYTGSCKALTEVVSQRLLSGLSSLTFTGQAGTTYLIEVTDWWGDGPGGGILHLALNFLKWEFKAAPNGDPGLNRICIDPDDDNLWYVASRANGLYITRDAGNTWKQHLKGKTWGLFIDPINPNRIYAGSAASAGPFSYCDLYRSDDKGRTWLLMKSFPTDLSIDCILVSSIDGAVFVGLYWGDSSSPNGMYRSIDYGQNWSFYPFNIPPLPDNQHTGLHTWDIAEDSEYGILYVGVEPAGKPPCFPRCYDPPTLRSWDRGQTWQDVSGDPHDPGSLSWHATRIQVHPVTHDVYFQEEGGYVYESRDFGDSWETCGPSSMNMCCDLIIDHNYPTRFFGGECSGQVRLSMDTGRSFVLVGPAGLGGNSYFRVALNSKSTRLYAAGETASPSPVGIYVADLIDGVAKPTRVGVRATIDRSSASDVRICWDSVSGLIYQIQYRSQPTATRWLDLGPPVTATGPRTCVTEAVGQLHRFFRVLGPDMVWIPAGTFLMGSPPTEPGRSSEEGPQTTVTISQGFWMGKYEVTQAEYLDVVGTNPSVFRGDANRPVELVSWMDATNYCTRLTARERLAGRLPAGHVYRLPTEAEWEYACRAGTTMRFHYGSDLRSGMANFDGRYEYPPCGGSSYFCENPNGTVLGRTTAVGSYRPNAWGLYDLHGNLSEWCWDWFGPYPGGSVTDPAGPATGSSRMLRGGDLYCWAYSCRSASRASNSPNTATTNTGFRVVLAQPVLQVPANMVFIQAGTFTMGSPQTEPARDIDEGPQTAVTISRGFWIGRYEVTQAEYLDVMGNNPSFFTGDLNWPVERVSWTDATDYCAQLSARERLAGRLPVGYEYRLPTEAEWEYTCRAGTTTAFHYGNELRSGMSNFDGQYEYPSCGGEPYYCYNPSGIYLERTTVVGSYAPNTWGLYDMHGNVWEWCLDWYGPYSGGSVTDPAGPASGSARVFRGGGWNGYGYVCRSAYRSGDLPGNRYLNFGFRVALVAVP
jgi:formylglycine-generating enzyme required for sulfatase activity